MRRKSLSRSVVENVDDTEEIMRFQKRRRVWRGVGYALLMGAGIFSLIYPSQIIQSQVTSFVNLLWSAGMAASGLICLWGSVVNKWIYEFVALPLLGSTVGLFALAAIFSVRDQTPALLIYGGVMLALMALLVDAWLEVALVKKVSEEEGQLGGDV